MKKSILVLTLLGLMSLSVVANHTYENGKEINKYEKSIKKEYNKHDNKLKNNRHSKKNYLKDLNLTPEQKEKYKLYKERKRKERINELSSELDLTTEQVEKLNKKMKY